MKAHPQPFPFMAAALDLAQQAGALGEVPVGAVITLDGKIIAAAANTRERQQCATGHAEMLAIAEACRLLGSWRLSKCELYVTLEPCLMCAGAISQARIPRVIYGASDPKAGALGSLYHVHQDPRLNHRFEVVAGIEAAACGALLKNFFRARRIQGRANLKPTKTSEH